MCKHLQKLMPRASGKSVQYTPVSWIEAAATYEIMDEEDLFREMLSFFNLGKLSEDVLVLRYVYSYTHIEIARTLGLPKDRRTAWSLERRALNKIKKSLEMP